MLFDFFAHIDFHHLPESGEDPFDHHPPYHKLHYQVREEASDYSRVFSLHKGAKDNSACYQDSQWEVYVFGYCLTKLEGRYADHPRKLKAKEIASAYQEMGEDFVHEVKGSFAILLLDKVNQRFHVFTDPLNVRPVYYFTHEGGFYVSSSLSTMIHYRKARHWPVDLNYPAIMEYYLFEYSLKDDSFVESIDIVPPGSYLHYDDTLSVHQYWNPFQALSVNEPFFNEKESLDRLDDLLRQNLALHLFRPERTAVALTGGYDSRTNLALLGNRAKDFQFYSYGKQGTYDLRIPARVARSQNLHYKAITLDDHYQQHFSKYARMAIGLGDGLAEANRANYPYAFKKLSPRYDYILTGLFGSELIKPPSSVGDFINEDMKQLLQSPDPEQSLDLILEKARLQSVFDEEIIREYGPTVKERVLSDRYVVNNQPFPKKYFFFLLMQGVRKYFMKELKVERPFVSNLHPFLDIEFISLLLQTPYPWVYNWSGDKELSRSLQAHRLYVSIIQRNKPALARMLSTHGYTPALVNHRIFLPLLALQYKFYKKRIRRKGSFRSGDQTLDFIHEEKLLFSGESFLHISRITNTKNLTKMASLEKWLTIHGLQKQAIKV